MSYEGGAQRVKNRCMKCKEDREFTVDKVTIGDRGGIRLSGKCPVCTGPMSMFAKRDDLQKYKDAGVRVEDKRTKKKGGASRRKKSSRRGASAGKKKRSRRARSRK